MSIQYINLPRGEMGKMLNLYRLNYYTTTLFLIAGSFTVFGETTTEVHLSDTSTTDHSHKNSENEWTSDSQNNGQPNLSKIPADHLNAYHAHPTGITYATQNNTQQYHVYMQVAETILTMLRLSPLLAREMQRCLSESKTFQEILTHLPRNVPKEDAPLDTFAAKKFSKKVNQRKRQVR